MTARSTPLGRTAATDLRSFAAGRKARFALLCALAVFGCAASPALADPSPDPAPNGPSPDPAPVKPKPTPPKPVSHPAPVVHTPAPAPVHVTPAPTPKSVTVAPPPPAPAPVRHVVHHARHRHHKAAHRAHHRVAHPKPAPTTTAADPVQVAAAPPVKALRTAALTPVKLAKGDGSDSAKLLLLAGFALILVAIASASLLRLALQHGSPQRGW